jgi:hypothetical protein
MTRGLWHVPAVRVVGLLMVSWLASGCITSRSFQPATTLGKGTAEVDVEVASRMQFAEGSFDQTAHDLGVAVGGTLGVTNHLDARLTLSGDLLGAQVKYALLQNRDKDGLTLSVAPYVSVLFWPFGYSVGAELPVLLGWRVTDHTELVLAASAKGNRATRVFDRELGYLSRSLGGSASIHSWFGDALRLTLGLGVFHAVGMRGATRWNGPQVQVALGVAYHFDTWLSR